MSTDYLAPLSDDEDDALGMAETGPLIHLDVDNLILSEEDDLDDSDLLDDSLLDVEDGEYAAGQRETLPEVIRSFIAYFHRHLSERNVHELHAIYETSFPKLTEKFFRQHPWPAVALVAPLVEEDELFLMLYRELWYRHLYAHFKPTFQQRLDSWENYCSFFTYLLTAASPVALDLPVQWLWDIVDEFVFQFQSFRQFQALSAASLSPEERLVLQQNPHTWNARDVLFYLNELVKKSNIVPILRAEHRMASFDEIRALSGPFGSRNLYRMLGYFAIISLSRAHCLLGDYHLALKTLDPIEFNRKGLYTRVTSCHVSLYYHLGFAYLMSRRYPDAIKAFYTILLFISRSRSQMGYRSPQDASTKRADKLQALLAIATSLCPQQRIFDETLNTSLWDALNDKMTRMQRGDISAFAELFDFAAPKFISPTDSSADSSTVGNAPAAASASPATPATPTTEASRGGASRAMRNQSKLFLEEIKQHVLIPTIRSYLKLYATIDVDKLARFLEIDVKELTQLLMAFKHKTETKRWVPGTPPLQGQPSVSGDLKFYFYQHMVHISSGKGPRRYSSYYIRQINRFDEILHDLQKTNATANSAAASSTVAH